MVFTLLLSCGLAAVPFVAVAQTLMSGGIIESHGPGPAQFRPVGRRESEFRNFSHSKNHSPR